MTTFRVTAEHRAIFDFVRHGAGHGLVRATAGAGKTSTLVEIARRLPDDLRVAFLAFNRHTANELRTRLPAHVTAMTVHSLGRQALRTALGSVIGNAQRDKYREMIAHDLFEHHPLLTPTALRETLEYAVALVRFARLTLSNTAPEAVAELGATYDLEPPDDPEIEHWIHHRLSDWLERGVGALLEAGLHDYEDMLYAPLKRNFAPPRFAFIFVDEAQDLSAAQLRLTLNALEDGGRALFVGDPFQSIYGWAGADTGSLERIERETDATALGLSTTYRCPARHVALAQALSPDIRAAPGGRAGNVHWIRSAVLKNWVRPGDLVLARTKAALAAALAVLLDAGVVAVLKNDVQAFRDTAQKLPADVELWSAALEQIETRRVRRAERKKLSVEPIRDHFRALRVYVEVARRTGVRTRTALLEFLARLARDSNDAVRLSTVHGAKGLEADRVFILEPEAFTAVSSRTVEALRGEACVQFVALTRSRRDLVFVESPPQERLEDVMLRG